MVLVDDVDSVASCENNFVFNFIGIFEFSKLHCHRSFDPVVEDEVWFAKSFLTSSGRVREDLLDGNITVEPDLILSNIFSYICKD